VFGKLLLVTRREVTLVVVVVELATEVAGVVVAPLQVAT